MTAKECYEFMNGDYEDVEGRLLTEERIIKYLNRFKESQEYSLMVEALEEENYEVAFRAVHNLKGISLNLGFTGLIKASTELCESLRNGKPTGDISPLLAEVTKEYNLVIDAVKEL